MGVRAQIPAYVALALHSRIKKYLTLLWLGITPYIPVQTLKVTRRKVKACLTSDFYEVR
jgi:hypothetical protein